MLPPNFALNSAALLMVAILGSIALLSLAQGRVCKLEIRGRKPSLLRRALLLTAGSWTAVSLSVIEGFLILFFTEGFTQELPIRSQQQLLTHRELAGVEILTAYTSLLHSLDYATGSNETVKWLPYNQLTELLGSPGSRRIVILTPQQDVFYYEQLYCNLAAISLPQLPANYLGSYTM